MFASSAFAALLQLMHHRQLTFSGRPGLETCFGLNSTAGHRHIASGLSRTINFGKGSKRRIREFGGKPSRSSQLRYFYSPCLFCPTC